MNKVYSRIQWENYPSDNTPLNESNLNRMDSAIDVIDDRVVTLDTTKLDQITANEMVRDVTINTTNGVITVTYLNGSSAIYDTKLEKIAINFTYNPATQKLIIYLDDGTTQEIDLSSLITEYDFVDTDTIDISVDNTGKTSAIVKDGSIQERHLRPDYLADIMVEAGSASQSSQSAGQSAQSAASSAVEAESYAHGGTSTRANENIDNAKYYSDKAAADVQTAESILSAVEAAGIDAVNAVNDAVDIASPNFVMNLETGHLLYEGIRFEFTINENGHLEWRLAV